MCVSNVFKFTNIQLQLLKLNCFLCSWLPTINLIVSSFVYQMCLVWLLKIALFAIKLLLFQVFGSLCTIAQDDLCIYRARKCCLSMCLIWKYEISIVAKLASFMLLAPSVQLLKKHYSVSTQGRETLALRVCIKCL